MPRTRLPVRAGLAILACVAPAYAEDAPPAPAPAMTDAPPAPAAAATPAERLRAARAALPLPTPDRAFTFEADVWLGEARFGVASYAAKPAGTKEHPRWEVTEHSETQGGVNRQRSDTTAVLDRQLRVVSYERSIRVEGEAASTTKVAFTETGELRVVRTDKDGDETVTTDDGALDATATLAGLLVLLRETRLLTGAYDLPMFVHDSGTVETARLDVRGPGTLEFGALKREALVAGFALGAFAFDLYLDPKDRQPLAIRHLGRGITFLAKSLDVAEDAEPLATDGPAPTAKDCGLRLALGLVTGDLALVERVIDWPAYHAASKTRGLEEDDLAAFKALALRAFEQMVQHTDRPKADAVVRGAGAGAVEEPSGDGVIVRLGAPFEGVRYRAVATDGAWKIVDFPGPR
jgi:hypothetical protein